MLSSSKVSSVSSFEELFSRDLLLSEKFRALILAAISGIIAVYIFALYIFFNDYLNLTSEMEPPYLWAVLIFAVLAFRSFFISKRLEHIYERHKKFYPVFRYLNAFIEASVPTIFILIFARAFDTTSALISPPVLFYFVFIILSILELDFKLCLFTGFIAASEYVVLAHYYLQSFSQDHTNILQYSPSLYNGKGLLIFVCGIIAGLISLQIKKRIFATYDTIDKKNRLEKLFGQQVSPEIVEEMIRTKQEIVSKKRNVCVMFLDIRDFTSFSEKKSPEEIVQYQNDVFSFMIEIVNVNHGIINQFLGDGFMATFGAPIQYNNDCQNAVNAAIAIIKYLNDAKLNTKISKTRVGIGIHYGEVVTGNVGTNIRKQYSITGNTVILAARLEQLNKEFNSSVLISQEVLKKISNGFTPEFLGSVNVKGKTEPVEVYKLA
jgi:adenylate cyclase